MNNPVFTGVCTALVTPFLDDKINYPLVEQLLRRQIDAGVSAVVLSGTTGESPTLSDKEKHELFKRAKDYVGDSCTIIAGTGTQQITQYDSASQPKRQAQMHYLSSLHTTTKQTPKDCSHTLCPLHIQ